MIKFHPKGADVGPQKLKIFTEIRNMERLNRSDPITANSSNMRVYYIPRYIPIMVKFGVKQFNYGHTLACKIRL